MKGLMMDDQTSFLSALSQAVDAGTLSLSEARWRWEQAHGKIPIRWENMTQTFVLA